MLILLAISLWLLFACVAFFTHCFLIDRFCGERHLRYHVLLFGVAGEGIVLGGDLYTVKRLDVAVIVFHVQAIRLQRCALNVVILAAIVTIDHEAVFGVMAQLRTAEVFKAPATGHGVNVHLILEAVGAVFYLCGYLLALPCKPIGHVRKFGVAVVCGKCAILIQCPALAALGAEDLGALGCHFGLGLAVRALIEYLVQSLCAVRLGDENTVFLLVAVVVIAERFAHDGHDLLSGHLFDLFCGEDLCHRGVERHFSLLAEIPEGRVQVVAVVHDGNDGCFVHFDERTYGIGNVRIHAAGGIARFGIHAKDITATQYLANGFHEVEIRGEFSRADRTDPFHQPRAAIVAVDIYDVVDAVREGSHRGKLEIDEIHMIGKDHIGRLQAFHVDLFDLVFLPDEHHFRKNPNEQHEVDRLADGIFRCFVTFFVFVIYINIHSVTLQT